MKSIPTAVVWDQNVELAERKKDAITREDEDVWDRMEHVTDGNNEGSSRKKKQRSIDG
jgi:hypothetical protein